MHYKRLLVAVILLPVFYLYVMYLPSEYFLYLIIFVSTIALSEFYAMFNIRAVLRFLGVAWGVVVLVLFYIYNQLSTSTMLFSVLTIMAVRLLFRRDPHNAAHDVATTLLGLFYIPGLLACQLSLVKIGPEWIILLYAAVWASDSMAYYIGTAFGKRKLYEEISPNKTVAGAFGSVVGGMLGTLVLKMAFFDQVSMAQALLVGSVIGVTSMLGDLVESMFKRDAGVKDSSNFIPGHGGLMDKLDGVTFSGPVLYWLGTGLGLFY